MTEEELKNIAAPKEKNAPLTERQKKRNTIFLQLGGAALLFVFGFVLVPVFIIAAKFFWVEVLKNEDGTAFLSAVMFFVIVLAWFLSRLVCKAIVRKFGEEKFGAETVQFYLR